MALDTTGLVQVGEFSAGLNKRRLIRAMKNPMDRCTIVSILPKEIDEVKFTIEPGKFHIPAGTYEQPSTLVVGPSSWWKDIDIEQPMLEIPVSSIQIANSIITDYSNGMLGCDMSTAMPGLFFVLGEVKLVEIRMRYKEKLEETKIRQDNWFKILINIADSLWARSNGNPLTVSDEMRLAAKCLNLIDKPWLRDFARIAMVKCKACGALKDPEFPVCGTCRAIDESHPLSKNLKFA